MLKLEGLLRAATRTLNQAVKWRDPPPVITENIHDEDVKIHMEFINNMREAVNNLRYAEPWVAVDEDRQLCRDYHALLLELIPKFESCSTSPNKEHVDQAQEALHFTKRIIDGMVAMNDPTAPTRTEPTGEPTPGSSAPAQDPLKPPEIVSAYTLAEYLPRIKRALFKRSQTTERGEGRITARYKTYFNSALADLGVIYSWKDIPTAATFKPQWAGQDFETWEHTVKTANKLIEEWHVTRILEPWIVNKKVWKEYKMHHDKARDLGEEIENSKEISPDKWKEISEELAWYTMKIGNPVQLFEENEPRNRVSDVDDSGEGSSNNDGDNNDNVDSQSDFPSQVPMDDESIRQDMGTNTGDVPNENTPVDMTGDNNKVGTPSTEKEVDKAATAEQGDKGSGGTSSRKNPWTNQSHHTPAVQQEHH